MCGPEILLLVFPILNNTANEALCDEWCLTARPDASTSKVQNTQLELGSFRYPLHHIILKLHES